MASLAILGFVHTRWQQRFDNSFAPSGERAQVLAKNDAGIIHVPDATLDAKMFSKIHWPLSWTRSDAQQQSFSEVRPSVQPMTDGTLMGTWHFESKLVLLLAQIAL